MKKYLFEILLLLFSVAIPLALDMNLAVYGMLATFLLFLTLRRLNYWLFAIIFSFVLLTCVLFLPQIIWFGHPPATMIGAFFETDFQESKEFMQQLPFYSYGVSVLTLLFGSFILYLGKKKKTIYNRQQWFITLGRGRFPVAKHTYGAYCVLCFYLPQCEELQTIAQGAQPKH